MSELAALRQRILQRGTDLHIDDADWAEIAALLPSDSLPADDDLRVLVEMRTEARIVCAAFDDYFFPAFKAYLLRDGDLSQTEQFHLLRMLYGGGGVDDREKAFLRDLRRSLKVVSPEFQSMYDVAMKETHDHA